MSDVATKPHDHMTTKPPSHLQGTQRPQPRRRRALAHHLLLRPFRLRSRGEGADQLFEGRLSVRRADVDHYGHAVGAFQPLDLLEYVGKFIIDRYLQTVARSCLPLHGKSE